MTTWRVPDRYTPRQIVHAVRHAQSPERDLTRDRYQTRDGQTFTPSEYVRWFRRQLIAKIHHAESPSPRGRKDTSDWWREMSCVARMVNTPRLIVRTYSVPVEFRDRLAHRLTDPTEE